jgi:hypothetical protein
MLITGAIRGEIYRLVTHGEQSVRNDSSRCSHHVCRLLRRVRAARLLKPVMESRSSYRYTEPNGVSASIASNSGGSCTPASERLPDRIAKSWVLRNVPPEGLQQFLGCLLTVESEYLIADIDGVSHFVQKCRVLSCLSQKETRLLMPLHRELRRW